MYTIVNNIPNVKMLILYLMVLQYLNDKKRTITYTMITLFLRSRLSKKF